MTDDDIVNALKDGIVRAEDIQWYTENRCVALEKDNEALEKENEALKAQIDELKSNSGYVAYIERGRKIYELEAEIQNLEGIKLAQETALSKEYIIKEQLQKENAELRAQIEKMKCCQNCSHLCSRCELGG